MQETHIGNENRTCCMILQNAPKFAQTTS